MSYVFEPNTICPTRGVDKIFTKMKGIVPVYICARTCDYSLMFHRLESASEPVESIILDDQDIIRGQFEKKMQRIVHSIQARKSPSVIVLVATCLPQIIGVSLDNFASKVSTELGIPVIVSNVEALNYSNFRDGEDKAIEVLTKIMNHGVRKDQDVNIIGVSRASEQLEITGILQKGGINVNTVLPSDDLESVKKAPLARANLIVSASYPRTANSFKKKYNLDYITTTLPIGFTASRRFYLDIARYFSIEDKVKELILYKEKEVYKSLEKQINFLKGKKVAIFGSTLDEIPLALALTEVGMDVVYISTTTPNVLVKNQIELMKEEGIILDNKIKTSLNISEELEFIYKNKLDFVLGNFPHIDLAKGLGIPGAQIIWSLQRKIGFDGMSYIVNFCYKYMNLKIFKSQLKLKEIFKRSEIG